MDRRLLVCAAPRSGLLKKVWNMAKLKTNRAAAKRFRPTGGSKIKRGQAYRRHILTSKSRTRKRNLRQIGYVDATNENSVRDLLPYA